MAKKAKDKANELKDKAVRKANELKDKAVRKAEEAKDEAVRKAEEKADEDTGDEATGDEDTASGSEDELLSTGCPSFAVHFNGMCYASMDRKGADSTEVSGCRNSYLLMDPFEGWQLVPFSTQVLQNVVRKHRFGGYKRQIVFFANGAGYRTISGSPYGGARSGFTSTVKKANGVQYFKTFECNDKVLMQRSARKNAPSNVPSIMPTNTPTNAPSGAPTT